MAASQELKDRMMYENRGHCLLEACRQADLSKVKKFLSSSSNTSAYVAELLAFKHPYSGDNAVHCTVVSPFPKRKAIGMCISKITIFYTEILTRKVDLRSFFSRVKKIRKSTFQDTISVRRP